MRRHLSVIAASALVLGAAGAAGAASGPTHIDLPDGWQPEGIAAGRGHDLYVGSIPTGAVRRINAKTGEQENAVEPQAGRRAIGIKVEWRRDAKTKKARASAKRRRADRIWVAGGPTGDGYVYSARTGDTLKAFDFTALTDTFVNDVVLSKRAAYFTDSRRPVLYVAKRDLSGFSELPLTGITFTAGNNLNGIEYGRGVILAIQGNLGILWRIDPATGAATQVDLGGKTLPNGDGLLLVGETLYVVQNRLNKVAVLDLDDDFSSATIEKELTSDDFDVPTTVAKKHGRLYLPNARFGTTDPQPADYWITAIKP